jgi:hypothetical protein
MVTLFVIGQVFTQTVGTYGITYINVKNILN